MTIPGSLNIDDLRSRFPADFTPDELACAQTIFLKRLSVEAHRFYEGKMITVPKAGVYGFGWFGVWYTPGVSAVSTAIRDDNDQSFELSNRGNMVAVISDSTRVLGDGDVTPPGGLGVMEGKAFLMYYLGGLSAQAICVDSKDERGRNDPERMIQFTRMIAPSFGGVNLEDISQPNCYRVLDGLQDCGIPVWHDDAQGTACVTLAGLINALQVVGKRLPEVRIVLLGAGSSNTTVARLLMKDGADPARIVVFDTKGGLHARRDDIAADPRYYRKQELCLATNPGCLDSIEQAIAGADVLVSLSRPGPGVVQPAWISRMAEKAIVFACANPVPEIYPHQARQAGAAIVATGRSDFANQVNNSLGFPGILKGALLVRATRITDGMAIAAAHAIAAAARRKGLSEDAIMPLMTDDGVYPETARAVAAQAMAEGVTRRQLPPEQVQAMAHRDIQEARTMVHHLMDHGFIKEPPPEMIQRVLAETVAQLRPGSQPCHTAAQG